MGVVRDPSADPSLCLGCHDRPQGDLAAVDGAAYAANLHGNLWGYRWLIEQRSGVDLAGSGHEEQFQRDCAGCHATCGQCHVSRPLSVGGGFPKTATYMAHRFVKTPHITEQCTACHGTRVGDDYLGNIAGNEPDIHRQRGYKCEFCHTATEIHGDGQATGEHYDHRYEVASLPRCEDCHEASGDNPYHEAHVGVAGRRLQCQVCHAQPYKNCTHCHDLVPDGGKATTEPTQIRLKIARNPSPQWRPDYDYVLVRHVPVATDTYADWGLDLPRYLELPTWKYTSPHSIRRWTAQTTVPAGQDCFVSCHNAPSDSSGFLLRESDLRDAQGNPLPDYQANIGLVIPDDWPGEDRR